MFVIYKITNKTTGKIYIGKTKNLVLRIRDHKCNKKSYLGRAIQKYGFDDFLVETIYETDDEHDLEVKEYEFIEKLSSKSPNGYNCTYKTDSKLTRSDDSRKRAAVKAQHIGRTKNTNASSPFIGVRLPVNATNYRVAIQIDKITYTKNEPSELEAAILYDKLALFYYGQNAKINFPDKKQQYSKEELEQTFIDFIEFNKKSRRRSKYKRFVTINKLSGKWCISTKLKNPDKIKLGLYVNEEEAATVVDYLIIYYGYPPILNFPHRNYNFEEIKQTVNDHRKENRKLRIELDWHYSI